MPKPASLLSLAFLAACMAVEKPRLPPPPAAAPAAGEFVDDPHSGNGYNLDDYAALTGRAVPGFREPPLLAERVARGELPPVSERLPDNPLVIVPWEEIGSYGGTLRYAATGFVGDTYLRYFNETQLLEIKPEPGTSPSAAAAHAGDGVPGTRGLGAVVHLHARAPLGGGGVRAGQGSRRRELPDPRPLAARGAAQPGGPRARAQPLLLQDRPGGEPASLHRPPGAHLRLRHPDEEPQDHLGGDRPAVPVDAAQRLPAAQAQRGGRGLPRRHHAHRPGVPPHLPFQLPHEGPGLEPHHRRRPLPPRSVARLQPSGDERGAVARGRQAVAAGAAPRQPLVRSVVRRLLRRVRPRARPPAPRRDGAGLGRGAPLPPAPRRRAADPHPPLPVGADRVGQRRRDGPGILERPRHRRHRQVLRPARPAAGGQRGSPSTW